MLYPYSHDLSWMLTRLVSFFFNYSSFQFHSKVFSVWNRGNLCKFNLSVRIIRLYNPCIWLVVAGTILIGLWIVCFRGRHIKISVCSSYIKIYNFLKQLPKWHFTIYVIKDACLKTFSFSSNALLPSKVFLLQKLLLVDEKGHGER